MTKRERKDYMDILAKEVARKYDIELDLAEEMVESSLTENLLIEVPEYMIHVSLYSIADDVWNEWHGLPVDF